MQAQFCSPVSILIRTPLASFAIITHSFNDRNLILRKTGGEYAKREREAEGRTLIFRFCVKQGANTQNRSVKPRRATLIFRFCVKPGANTQNGGEKPRGTALIFRFCVKPRANTQNGGEKPRGAALIFRFCVKPRVNTQNGGGLWGVVFVAKRLRVWYHFNVLICFKGCGFDHMIADACKSKL